MTNDERTEDGTPVHHPYGPITMRELVEASPAIADLKRNGGTFDYALPQSWWDAFHETMGKPPLGFVWAYAEHEIWGHPMPVSFQAKEDLDEYVKRGGPR